jgi:Bacterial archaeo-eukaryotic release factor family 2
VEGEIRTAGAHGTMLGGGTDTHAGSRGSRAWGPGKRARMETSEAVPIGAVRAPDLAGVASRPGPFATAYLSTEPNVERAAHRSEQAWKSLRRQLLDEGAPSSAVEAIDPWVAEAHLHGRSLAVVASREGTVHLEHGPAPVPTDVATWAPLPSLSRILAWRQAEPPYVTVRIDRRGADIAGIRREAPPVEVEAEGKDEPIRKASPGGWSQRRYQQRAENTWEQNAKNVAESLTSVVDRVGARLVVAAGDVRALQLLKDELPERIVEMLEVVDGGRADDGSDDAFDEAVEAAVERLARSDRERILDAFQRELGQQDKAADGVVRTLRALSMSQVEVLLVSEDAEDDRTAWFGPDATQVAPDAETLRSLGVEPLGEGRLVDVAIRAALGTAASVLVLPPGQGPREGLGAILRWGPTR